MQMTCSSGTPVFDRTKVREFHAKHALLSDERPHRSADKRVQRERTRAYGCWRETAFEQFAVAVLSTADTARHDEP
jgi:hypothetical protein